MIEKKKVGVWLDQEKALLFSLVGEKVIMNRIQSNVEDYHAFGGSPAKTPYGTQDATSEGKLLKRKKQQLKNYFKEIIHDLKDADEIYISGPAQTKLGLEKEINKLVTLSKKLTKVETVNSLTENQVRAKIIDFFKTRKASP